MTKLREDIACCLWYNEDHQLYDVELLSIFVHGKEWSKYSVEQVCTIEFPYKGKYHWTVHFRDGTSAVIQGWLTVNYKEIK